MFLVEPSDRAIQVADNAAMGAAGNLGHFQDSSPEFER